MKKCFASFLQGVFVEITFHCKLSLLTEANQFSKSDFFHRVMPRLSFTGAGNVSSLTSFQTVETPSEQMLATCLTSYRRSISFDILNTSKMPHKKACKKCSVSLH